MLPFQLRCVGVTETELREELEDGIEYKRSDQGKLAIEEKPHRNREHQPLVRCAMFNINLFPTTTRTRRRDFGPEGAS